MSEAEELAQLIYDAVMLEDSVTNTINQLTRSIMDAGYRRIPDDCVVVRREYLDLAESFLSTEDQGQYWATEDDSEKSLTIGELVIELRAALTATRQGEEG